MSNDFKFQYANPCSLPYTYIYNFECNPSNFVVDNELFFFRVRHLKIKEKYFIHPPLHKSLLKNGAILHAIDWLFEVTL